MQDNNRLFVALISLVILASVTASAWYVYVLSTDAESAPTIYPAISSSGSQPIQPSQVNQQAQESVDSIGQGIINQSTPAPSSPLQSPYIDDNYYWAREILNVPFVSEAPDNNWTGSWKNACEEASVTMVDKYYQGIDKVSIEEEKKFMQTLFDAQVRQYGSDANSDSYRTLELIEKYTTFTGDIITDPDAEDIKSEIDQGRPVIAFHRGFDLKNDNIPFLSTGSSYHSTVVVGYDEKKLKFIVHDPGDTPSGKFHEYDYEIFMNSLHDYNFKTHMADGPARVIFTRMVPS